MTAPDRNGCTVGRAGYWISQFAGINRHHNQWGRLIFQIFGALAEFERNLIRERTQAGLTAARARGRKGGRPKSLDAKKTELAYQLYDEKKHTIKEICQMLGISKPSLYAYLEQRTSIGKKMIEANT